MGVQVDGLCGWCLPLRVDAALTEAPVAVDQLMCLKWQMGFIKRQIVYYCISKLNIKRNGSNWNLIKIRCFYLRQF